MFSYLHYTRQPQQRVSDAKVSADEIQGEKRKSIDLKYMRNIIKPIAMKPSKEFYFVLGFM